MPQTLLKDRARPVLRSSRRSAKQTWASASQLAREGAPLIDRGRDAAGAVARDVVEHLPLRPHRRGHRRARIVAIVLALAACTGLYLLWRRRERQRAALQVEFDPPASVPTDVPVSATSGEQSEVAGMDPEDPEDDVADGQQAEALAAPERPVSAAVS